MARMNGRHVYRITLLDGTKKRAFSKNDVESFVNCFKVDKVEKYKSNGFWDDVSSKYLKNRRI